MFVEAIGLSLVGALLSFEIVGLSPGGMIVPGYLALLGGRPYSLLVIATATGLVLLIVKCLAGYMILFSRRRFVLMVLIGFVCVRGVELILPNLSPAAADIQGIGYLVPGLMANDIEKQGLLPTLCMTILVSGIIHLVLVVSSSGAFL
jgi:poly-gamma-glutamate biosynthesis protein PgsC/CapC